MKIQYTEKLFYEKFLYKIVLEIETKSISRWDRKTSKTLINIENWCKKNVGEDNIKIIHRCKKNVRSSTIWHQFIYLSDSTSMDIILKKFGHYVKGICKPLNVDHEEMLNNNQIVEIRRSLLFNKFDQVIYFRYDSTGELGDWLLNYYKSNDSVKICGPKWWPRIYLSSGDDTSYITLSWGEYIDKIKNVKLVK